MEPNSMAQIGWIRWALLIFLSLPSIPAKEIIPDYNTTEEDIRTIVPTTKSITVTTLAVEVTLVTTVAPIQTPMKETLDTVAPVAITTPHPTTEITATVITATPELTSAPELTTDYITMTKPGHETTTVQKTTSNVLASTSETEMREIHRFSQSYPMTSKGFVSTTNLLDTDTTISPNTEPTNLQDIPPKTTIPYIQTTNQDNLISVSQVGSFHTSSSLTEDSYLTSNPSRTNSGRSESPTEEFTHAPSLVFVTRTQTIPGHATTTAVTHTSTSIAGEAMVPTSSSNLIWVIIVALLTGVIVVGAFYCICLVIRRKRRSHSEYLGSSFRTGKPSKRKKGAEQDAWAGPVKLGAGEEGVAGEDGGGAENDKSEGGRAEVVLSTFTANEGERNGPDKGVGMSGSKESKKWEEQEPLLYIDEGVDEEPERVSSEKHMDREGNGHQVGESERVQQNGGAAFCITTAV
ncbi:hypothetical protein UPYG_G00111400 [Umbra pygmaea]|uniref:Uncharacterized protein n=1 Tax=Umbra pygmaea TaxID=75934 RepID=A0ABD0XNA6_UMBPY